MGLLLHIDCDNLSQVRYLTSLYVSFTDVLNSS